MDDRPNVYTAALVSSDLVLGSDAGLVVGDKKYSTEHAALNSQQTVCGLEVENLLRELYRNNAPYACRDCASKLSV